MYILAQVMHELVDAVEHLMPAGHAAELHEALTVAEDAGKVAVDAEDVVTAVKDAAAKP